MPGPSSSCSGQNIGMTMVCVTHGQSKAMRVWLRAVKFSSHTAALHPVSETAYPTFPPEPKDRPQRL